MQKEHPAPVPNLESFLNMSVRKADLLKKFGAIEAGRTLIKGDQVGIVHLGKVRWLTQEQMDSLMNPETSKETHESN